MLLIQGLIVKTGCWRTLLLSPAIKVTGHHVQAALGVWWKMEDVLSEASFCLPDLVWRVSLSVVVWPYLKDDPVQNFLQALNDSAQKSCSFSAYLITRYCVMTKHPFPPVILSNPKSLSIPHPQNNKWAVSLEQTPGASLSVLWASG